MPYAAEILAEYIVQTSFEDMPKETITGPSVVFKPADLKTTVIGWDATTTLELWQKRQPYEGIPLPDVFTEISEVTGAPQDIVGRNKLVLKAKNSSEQKYYTTDNE